MCTNSCGRQKTPKYFLGKCANDLVQRYPMSYLRVHIGRTGGWFRRIIREYQKAKKVIRSVTDGVRKKNL